MSEFIVRTPGEWKSIKEQLPEVGKTIEVLCTMITKASLVGTEPQPQWMQEEGSEMMTDVKLWRDCEPT